MKTHIHTHFSNFCSFFGDFFFRSKQSVFSHALCIETYVTKPSPNYATRYVATHKSSVRCARFSPDGMILIMLICAQKQK